MEAVLRSKGGNTWECPKYNEVKCLHEFMIFNLVIMCLHMFSYPFLNYSSLNILSLLFTFHILYAAVSKFSHIKVCLLCFIYD